MKTIYFIQLIFLLSSILGVSAAFGSSVGVIGKKLNELACERALVHEGDFASWGYTACGLICEYNLMSGLEETFPGVSLTNGEDPQILMHEHKNRILEDQGVNSNLLADDLNRRLLAAHRSDQMKTGLLNIYNSPISERDLMRPNRAAILGYSFVTRSGGHKMNRLDHFILVNSIDPEKKVIFIRDPEDSNRKRSYTYSVDYFPGTIHRTLVLDNPDSPYEYYVDQMTFVDVFRGAGQF